MLDTIPPEILSYIALQLSLPTCEPPTNLLQTCRSIYQTLSPSANPRLYAKIYRACFDTAAAERRVGHLTAAALASELARRVKALKRLSQQVKARDVKHVLDEDLWVIYIMLIENDGKNMEHLLPEDAAFNLHKFLRLYHEQNLLVEAIKPGFPDETIGRTLVMWIAWLLRGLGQTEREPLEETGERRFILRPYVFAAHKYELYFAPWTIQDLPSEATNARLENPGAGSYIADLTPRSRVVYIEFYGRMLPLCAPILAHAAILRFFSKNLTSPASNSAGGPFNGIRDVTMATLGTARMDDEDTEDDETGDEDDESMGVSRDSRQHDRDFQRMTCCYDASICRGMQRTAWRGSWEGCWEGNFSFFEFDAFGEMLAGRPTALYRGSFGQQAQVWRIKETFVRPNRIDKGKTPLRGLPLRGPMTNAGFPTGQRMSASAGLPSATAEEAATQETIMQQVEALEGYEIVPDSKVDEAMADDGGEEAGLEILLTGTGHSAWGRFILKGRVRAWDGMASLVKEYAPDFRGKWIYRGYILSDNVFVGRWRDTYTPEELVGYEGTFILNRR